MEEPHHVGLLVGHMVEEAGVLVREAVVVLLPDVRREKVVETGDLRPPGQLFRHLEPFRVLGEHGVHDADEGLVAVENAVAAGEQVALQRALAHVLGEHGVHDAPVRRQELVFLPVLRVPVPVLHREHGPEPVGDGLVRAEHAEVLFLRVQAVHVADIGAERGHVGALHCAGRGDVHRIAAEIRQAQIVQQDAAVGMRVRAHAPLAPGRQCGDRRDRLARVREELFRTIAPQPLFQDLQMLRPRHGKGHLVRAEGALHRLAVHDLGAGPALGAPQHDHGPGRAGRVAVLTGGLPEAEDVLDAAVEGLRHERVHLLGIIALHEVRLPAAADKKALQLTVRDAGQNGGIGNLVAV